LSTAKIGERGSTQSLFGVDAATTICCSARGKQAANHWLDRCPSGYDGVKFGIGGALFDGVAMRWTHARANADGGAAVSVAGVTSKSAVTGS